jgi:hypothetical protein
MIDIERINYVVWMQTRIIVFNFIHHEYLSLNLSLFSQQSLWHIKAVSFAVKIFHESYEIQEELGGTSILVEAFNIELFIHANLGLKLDHESFFIESIPKIFIVIIRFRFGWLLLRLFIFTKTRWSIFLFILHFILDSLRFVFWIQYIGQHVPQLKKH